MSLIHLRSETTSLVLVADGDRLPAFAHWGGRLPDGVTEDTVRALTMPPVPHSSTDQPMPHRVLPMPADGWRMRPGLTGCRTDGTGFSPDFIVTNLQSSSSRLVVTASDAGLTLTMTYVVHPSGVLGVTASLTNDGPGEFRVDGLEVSLPLTADATELLDLTGRWCRERTPQRTPLQMGAWLRESRHGRTGHDAAYLMCAGTPGFGFRHGRVWAAHLAWSGDSRQYAERNPVGAAHLGAGELLASGEVRLSEGETYAAPELLAVFSDAGLDGVSNAFHDYVRARPSHPRRPRPVLLNTWEAVYFDHRLDVLKGLADAAAAAGIERFVLDDGWFGARRDDSSGLGDWVVSKDAWPDGLTPLIDYVRSLGMEFGLWVEPEMCNPDSDLVRDHPDWVLAVPGRQPPMWRRQQVVDLANPDCFAHILGQIDDLLRDNDIAFLKWDHNRDLIDPAHDGRPAVHAQTLAAYRLFDELRERHPAVEIETCASGGGRVDLGILARTDRLWASDTIDAVERQHIQLWTGLLVPPELVGAHIGGPHAHTTGRSHSFAMRAASAVFGHMGIEWNLAALSEAELALVTAAVAWHKEHRALLHSGDVVRLDQPTRDAIAHGVVSRDRREGVFSYAQLGTDITEVPGQLRLDGLDPDLDYRVEPVTLGQAPGSQQAVAPRWIGDGGAVASGRVLMTLGLALPVLQPEQALLIRLAAV